MQTFNYTIKDEIGIHARPAGLLVKCVEKISSSVTVTKGEQSADAKKLFALMKLGVKCGDEVTVTVSGDDEDSAVKEIKSFFESNL